ncbi:MAG: hypothetical protein IJH36_03160 [Clostridia bacterium]|nr:hypothetical protein [Clostridia bacterium]MBQ3462100.1 hypothetical protein [Clostridia bacterium]MBR0470985.1 hypothetical protein [Clostridia bacterium]
MAREKPSYRDNLERIKEMFPTKELLRVGEVVEFTGLSRWTVRKMFEFNNGYISVAKLARAIS